MAKSPSTNRAEEQSPPRATRPINPPRRNRLALTISIVFFTLWALFLFAMALRGGKL